MHFPKKILVLNTKQNAGLQMPFLYAKKYESLEVLIWRFYCIKLLLNTNYRWNIPFSECSDDDDALLLLALSELWDLLFPPFPADLLCDSDLFEGDLERLLPGDRECDLETPPLTGDVDLECDLDFERLFDFAPNWDFPLLLLWDSAAEEEELRDLEREWDLEAIFFLRLLSLSRDFFEAL